MLAGWKLFLRRLEKLSNVVSKEVFKKAHFKAKVNNSENKIHDASTFVINTKIGEVEKNW